MSDLIYGVVIKGTFYSNRTEIKLSTKVDNGIYSMDMEQDDFKTTIVPANLDDARQFFKKASKITLIRGISFHDCFIPENPVAYKTFPIKVLDATYDEFEEVEVVKVKDFYYYVQTIMGNKTYMLLDLKDLFASKKAVDLGKIKDLTPELRIACMFHLIERKNKEIEEPVNYIKTIMVACGAVVRSVTKRNIGYEVVWEYAGHVINTLLKKDFRVAEAGFCVSGNDETQSARSVVNVLKDYVRDGDHVNKTRVI